MRNFKRKAVGAVAAIFMSIGIGTAVASPASAYDYTETKLAEPYMVCQHQDHFAATSLNWLNPYSLVCYDLGTDGVTLAGGLDFNKFCHDVYGWQFNAEVVQQSIWGWRCVSHTYVG